MGRQPMESSWLSGNVELSIRLERVSANIRTWRGPEARSDRTEVSPGFRRLGEERLFYLTGTCRSAVPPVGEERPVKRLGIGVGVGAGCGQEVNVVREHVGASIRLGDVAEPSVDESLSRSQGAENIQSVVPGPKTCRSRQKPKPDQSQQRAEQPTQRHEETTETPFKDIGTAENKDENL